jgi:hypothetical protein
MTQKTVVIINFNTPEMCEAAIMSLRKHGGQDYRVIVFDNSTDVDYPATNQMAPMKMCARPFTRKMAGVEIIDNTKGQVVDLDAEMAKFPNKDDIGVNINNNGSARHMITVQTLFDIVPDGFLLLEPDVLIKKSVDFMFQPNRCAVGYIQEHQPGNNFDIPRLVPMLCYINPKQCNKSGVRYYDPERCWMLTNDRNRKHNWYDTGASFLEDIKAHKAQGSSGIKLSRDMYLSLMDHYGSGSWRRDKTRRGDGIPAEKWLMDRAKLWMPETWARPKSDKVAICAIGRLENKYAKEFVSHHLKLGFDKIIIYDNNHDGEEKFDTVLKTYITKKQVEIIDWRNRDHDQCYAYRDCYTRYGNDYQWIAFFDFDEHLKLTTSKNIKDVLNGIDADCVSLSWRTMSDNGLIVYTNESLEKRFTQPAPKGTKDHNGIVANYFLKTFVRGGLPWIYWTHPHTPVIKGTRLYIDGKTRLDGGACYQNPDYSVARLDHFTTKTISEWMTNKVVRGFGCKASNTAKLRNNPVDVFFCYNEKTPEKMEWLNKNGFVE